MRTLDNFESRQNYELFLGLIDEMKTTKSEKAMALTIFFLSKNREAQNHARKQRTERAYTFKQTHTGERTD